MRYLTVLLLLASPVAAQQATYVDPKLAEYDALIDSLALVTGGRPDTILLRLTPMYGPPNSTGYYEPKRHYMSVSPESQHRRRTLLHEFGHLFQADIVLFAWVDREVGNGAMPNWRDLEQFADDFADAFDALSHGAMPRTRGALFIAQALAQRAPFDTTQSYK
jgi:hypothetical protein